MSNAKEIAAEVAAILEARIAVTENEHAEHHQFIREQIQREHERREMYVALRQHLLKWGAVGVLSFLGMAAWYWLRNHL